MADGGTEFRVNRAGIVELFTSAAMQGVLKDAAEEMAGRANAIGHLHGDGNDRPLYAAKVDVGKHTAVGKVVTNTRLGRIDNFYHETLAKARGR